jgi:hypothetical protein
VSLDRKRWALLAQEIKFSQLEIARKRADAWRTGLATLTTLLTGVLVVKGRADVSALTLSSQVTVAVLLGVALITLLAGALWVSRAIAGPPDGEFMLTGEDLEEWTRGEVRAIERALTWVPRLSAASIIVVAAAVAVTWFAPAKPTTTVLLVRVTMSTGQQACGMLVGVGKRELIITSASVPTLIPLSAVVTVAPVAACA